MKLVRLLIPVLLISLAVALAGNWDRRHRASSLLPPPLPAKPKSITPPITPGHVAIQNGTDASMGFMVFPRNGVVVCPPLPPDFAAACIEVPPHGTVDYTVVRTEVQR